RGDGQATIKTSRPETSRCTYKLNPGHADVGSCLQNGPGQGQFGEIIGLSSQYMFRSQPNSVEYPCEKTD
ncbi:hypothetical protein PMS63_10960, partial [Bifidobacterium longum]|nr:hypothetical protein [Bifidobacterium longum]